MKHSSVIESSIRPFAYRDSKSPLHCEDVSLASLAAKYGTPAYVYSATHILNRYKLFAQAFAHRPHLICYAVKANSNLSILKLLADAGAGFDIVSGGELERILAVDKRAAKRTVFSGAGKTAAEIDLALKTGILLFNVESEGEIALLGERCAKLGKKARFALRVNPDVFAETHPYISTGLREHKFGIDIAVARNVYRQAAKSRYLEPAGISVHIGSQIRSAEPFGAAVCRVTALVRELRRDGIVIRFIDAGGGLGIDYQSMPITGTGSAKQGQPLTMPEWDPVQEVKRYAAAIEAGLEAGLGAGLETGLAAGHKPGQKPGSQAGPGSLDVTLLIEPGRFIVAQAGALLTKVLYVKRNGSKTFVIVDAGMNDLLRPSLYQAYHEIVPVAPARPPRGTSMRGAAVPLLPVDVVGPVCESGDFFARDRELPPVKPGELLAILDAGAYGSSLGSNYNSRPRPVEILVQGKRAKLIRARETPRSLFAAEQREL